MRKMRHYFHSFPSPLPLLFIIAGTIVVILYGRGYRPNLKDNTIKPTGLLSATSDPIGAQVYIDNKLSTATNNTLNIDPGWYTVTIVKEGYIAWQKKLRVQGEIVTRSDPFLFPTNPSLSPLTTVGIENPILSPDGTKIAYVIPIPSEQNGIVPKKAGLWVYELVDRQLGFSRDQRQVATTSDTVFNFSSAKLIWSPNSSQIMADNGRSIRLYQVNRLDDFQDITLSYQSILKEWEEEIKLLQKQKLSAFKPGIIDVVTTSTKLISFSPDESKILFEATTSAQIPQVLTPPLIGTNPTPEQRNIEPGKIYVYDSREDKNYLVLNKDELPKPKVTPSSSPKTNVKPAPSPSGIWDSELGTSGAKLPVHWFPTSRHLALTFEGKIDILEYDRTNWVTVYSGPFIDNFIAPWPNGSRIIILTNLNPGVSTLPNLYTVNLR